MDLWTMRYRAPGRLPWKSLTTFPPRVPSPTSSTELYSFRIKSQQVKTNRNTGQSTATGRAPLIQEHFLSKQTGPPLALATWSNEFLKAFTLKTEAASALIGRLEDQDPDARHYAAKFFMKQLPDIASTPASASRCIRAIVSAVKSDDGNVRQALINWIRYYPSEWQSKLAEALKEQTDEDNPAVYMDDGTAFLSSPTASDFDDDIPF